MLTRPILISLISVTCAAFACSSTSSEEIGSDSDEKEDDGGNTINPGGTGGSTGSVDDLKTQPAPDTCDDGVLQETEACDDGNRESGDGCFENCLFVEPGFTCSVPGEACRPFAKCGDGVVRFPEQCDNGDTDGDGKPEDDDGCSANCKIEIGSKCDGEPSVCTPTVCGDSVIEGSEGCDDGNTIPFDGCDTRCQIEPQCTAGAGCDSACGDGVLLRFKDGKPYEQCDDGNTTSGDGCSDTCEEEPGYECKNEPCEQVNGQCVLRVPAIFRDFRAGFADMKPDGDNSCGSTTGLVQADLDGEGKPVRNVTATNCLSSDANFAKWYRDTPGTNSTVVGDVLLFANGAGGFVNRYDRTTGAKYNGKDGNPTFFPLDTQPMCGAGESFGCIITPSGEFNASAVPPDFYGGDWNARSGSHNFHFTSEVTYWFQYDAGTPSTLSFLGDDDVWVFVNGKLAVDIGGVQVPTSGSITLSGTNAATYGLNDGNVYEITVFQAERKVVGSSFQLTLSGFNASRSECLPQCGDGIIGAGEECDDGVNDGGYNECQPGCVLGGYCGDGIVQEGETCDDNDPNAPADCSGCRVLVIK